MQQEQSFDDSIGDAGEFNIDQLSYKQINGRLPSIMMKNAPMTSSRNKTKIKANSNRRKRDSLPAISKEEGL